MSEVVYTKLTLEAVFSGALWWDHDFWRWLAYSIESEISVINLLSPSKRPEDGV